MDKTKTDAVPNFESISTGFSNFIRKIKIIELNYKKME